MPARSSSRRGRCSSTRRSRPSSTVTRRLIHSVIVTPPASASIFIRSMSARSNRAETSPVVSGMAAIVPPGADNSPALSPPRHPPGIAGFESQLNYREGCPMFDLGDPVPLTFTTHDAAGTLASATTVTVTITLPDQTTVTQTVTPASTGTYVYTYTPTLPGRHRVRWQATGTNASADTDAFDVDDTSAGYIISLADAKTALGKTSTVNDEDLRLYLAATTKMIENYVGPVGYTTHTEIVEAADTIVLAKRPVLSVTSIVQTFPWPGIYVPTYLLDGPAGLLRQQPLVNSFNGPEYCTTHGLRLTVTYTVGRPQVPAPLQIAARLLVAELWSSRRGAMPLPARGGEEDVPVPGGGHLTAEILELLKPFARGMRTA